MTDENEQKPVVVTMEQMADMLAKLQGKKRPKPQGVHLDHGPIPPGQACGSSQFYWLPLSPKTAKIASDFDQADYLEIHLFLRPGDTWQKLVLDAKDRKEYAPPHTRVIAHEHARNEMCLHPNNPHIRQKCKEV